MMKTMRTQEGELIRFDDGIPEGVTNPNPTVIPDATNPATLFDPIEQLRQDRARKLSVSGGGINVVPGELTSDKIRIPEPGDNWFYSEAKDKINAAGANLARAITSWPTLNTQEEHARVVSKLLPNNEIRRVPDPDKPGSNVLLIEQPAGSGQFVEFDSMFDTSRGDVMDVAGAIVNPSTAVSGGLAMATGGISGLAGMFVRPAAQAAGLAGTTVAATEIGRLLGIDASTNEEMTNQAQLEGVLGGGFSAAAEIPAMFARGARNIMTTPAEAERAGAINEVLMPWVQENLDPAVAKQLGFKGVGIELSNPLIRQAAMQISKSDITGSELRRNQQEALVKAIGGARDRLINSTTPPTIDDLRSVADTMRGRIISYAELPYSTEMPRDLGERFVGALQAYDDVVEKAKGAAFDNVRRLAGIDDIRWHLATPVVPASENAPMGESLLNVARRLKVGTTSPLQQGEQLARSPAMAKFIQKGGQPPVEGGPLFNRDEGPFGGELKQLIDEILSIQPEIATHTHNEAGTLLTSNSYDQIRHFRTRAFHLISDDDPITSRMAVELHDALKRTMEAPVGGSKAFRTALDDANKLYRESEEAWSALRIKQITNRFKTDPGMAAERIIHPERPEDILRLKKILTDANQPELFDSMRDSWVAGLADDPKKGLEMLSKFEKHPASLKLLMTPDQKNKIVEALGNLTDFYDTSVWKAAESAQKLGQEVVAGMFKKDSQALQEFIATAGGKDSPIGRRARWGVWQHILNESQTMENGRLVLQVGKAESVAKDLLESGTLETVMTPHEMEVIKNIRDYLSYVKSADGSGAGLAVGGLVGSALSLRGAALVKIARNAVIANVIMDSGWGGTIVRRAAGAKGKAGAITVMGSLFGAKLAQAISNTVEDNNRLGEGKPGVGAIQIDDNSILRALGRAISEGISQPSDMNNPAPPPAGVP